MKWYKHDPAAFIEGCLELTPEEIGFYIILIDLLYARAPNGTVTDALVCKATSCRPLRWRRVKAVLIAKGKVHETEGKLTANRVANTISTAVELMLNRSRTERLLKLKEAERAKINGLGWERQNSLSRITRTRLSK